MLWSKAASGMPDSPVERQLLGDEMQLLNYISGLLNLKERQREPGEVKREREREHDKTIKRWTSRQAITGAVST